jgi:hypothetical protein
MKKMKLKLKRNGHWSGTIHLFYASALGPVSRHRSATLRDNASSQFSSHASKQQTPEADNTSNIMSDLEDDMDVDAPVVQDSVLFSSDNINSKGKRNIANLPVEAEDSLPW